ncbi:MAG: hypothetical protein Q7U15_06080 [Methylotenera sp.]|nr:hypothetical protein [Methylotenera sp.]
MKNLIVLFLLLASSVVLADQQTCVQLKSEGTTQEQLARRGCCSHHGGVCGCNGDRAKCCDGSLSPSCGCHATDQKDMRPHEADTPKT